ncbi:MAG: type III-B CRISPR module RAMP protein Cmr6, partial [Gammaproteobacteria bacterium]|nr:type III-B CRISPR module RAMP protein Cmr6 [Gammaproteobacteria bacterium]
MDKWHTEFRDDPKFVRTELQRVTAATGDPALFATLLKRRAAALAGAVRWRSTSTSALAPHLARAGSFENAGLCLHPLYGFAYLPGTGLKGMARAWAEFHFGENDVDVLAVFGPSEIRKDGEAYAGAVVFFEAWPTKWPRLVVDIVNNHHRDYYEKAAPPEDWENPNIVNFLAVAPGTEFEFAVAARRKGDPEGERLVGLAKQWLDAALVWLGAGAKTNAGYGRFKGVGERPALPPNREVFECTLRLVSPAFLAGAMQGKEDCTLRPATVRGLLRWWWRTLHAGYLTVEELRRLEGRLWGTTEAGGLISVEVEPIANPVPKEMRVVMRNGEKPA